MRSSLVRPLLASGSPLVFLALLACAPAAAPQGRQTPGIVAPRGDVFVSGFESDAVHVFRAGVPRGSVSVSGAQSIARGPDKLLYVCAEKIDQVVRLDPETLGPAVPFVADDPLTAEDENGPLDGPTAATFGPDGDLFVASFETDQILRYDGETGAYEGVFVTAGSGQLNGPDAGTKWGPDGLLYVPSFWNDRVLRYDERGRFVDAFVSFREGGLRQPRDLVYHKGSWYVASSQNNRVLRFDEQGVFQDVFATVAQPYSLAFHPRDGNLYAVSLRNNAVRVFDGRDGSFLRTLVAPGDGGLSGAVFLSIGE